MKMFSLVLVLLVLILSTTQVQAGEDHYYIRVVYAKDPMSLSMLCDAVMDDNDNVIRYLHGSGLITLVQDRVEIRDVDIVKQSENVVELPTDMVSFKLMDDYRTYYTLYNHLDKVHR